MNKIIVKKKKKEVNIFLSSNVNFYSVLSHVLVSGSEIMIFFFFFFLNLTGSHHIKGYFSKCSYRPWTPLVLLGY